GVDHPGSALAYRFPHRLHGLVGGAFGSEPERAGQEIGLHDRLNDDLDGLLDHPIPHGSDAQRAPLVRTRFWDPYPAHRLRTVRTRPQLYRQLVEHLLHTGGLDLPDGDRVDPGSTLVGAHLQPRAPENITAVDPVVQRVETTLRRPLGRQVQ